MRNNLLKTGDVLLDRYRVLDYIDEGGMQQVFSAEDTAFNRRVAVKVPKSASAEKRFFRSAQISAQITHENVAKTLDYFEDSAGRPFLVEELISGVDLGKALKQKFYYLDPHLASHFVHLLSKGLAAAHHAGVFHRDLKPSNIMIDSSCCFQMVKITDFGISKMAETELNNATSGDENTLTSSTTAVGTLPYMAPEMIDKDRPLGKAADVWAVGAILYHIVAGSTPFGSAWSAITSILEARVPPKPTFMTSNPQFSALSEELWKIIVACLQGDQSKRPTADALVKMCSELCYSPAQRLPATVEKIRVKGAYGFMRAADASNFFFHEDSCYGTRPQVGDKVMVAAYSGHPARRAFPVLKIKT